MRSVDPRPSIDYRIDINEKLPILTTRERFVIEHHYGLNGVPPSGLASIAEYLAISRGRTTQIHAKALGKLRRNMAWSYQPLFRRRQWAALWEKISPSKSLSLEESTEDLIRSERSEVAMSPDIPPEVIFDPLTPYRDIIDFYTLSEHSLVFALRFLYDSGCRQFFTLEEITFSWKKLCELNTEWFMVGQVQLLLANSERVEFGCGGYRFKTD